MSISIHPPRVGWDVAVLYFSRLPADFNPPTPCGVGPQSSGRCTCPPPISIHPPRVGWDRRDRCPWAPSTRFQSTHPVWGGTISLSPVDGCELISIHPPRVGWDARCYTHTQSQRHFNPPTPCGVGHDGTLYTTKAQNFNPPTPCGVGRMPDISWDSIAPFQSTHPVWGGT